MEDWNVSTPIQVSVNVQGFDAATLNGLPGSFYLNAGNLTGTIDTARIPGLDWAKITTGKPTTIAGYGIADGYTKTEINTSLAGKQDINFNLTGISGLTGTAGIARKTAGVWGLDTSTYLTANQTITLSGDATGSGTTAIALTLANVVTAGSSAKPTYNAKGLITGSGSLVASDIPNLDWAKITTGKPTTLSGYAITDAVTTDTTQTVTGTKTFSVLNTSTSLVLDSKSATNNSIELGSTTNFSTPFIDFHSGATATDFDARIIASGGTGTSGNGTLSFNSASSTFVGSLVVSSSTASTSTTTGAMTVTGGVGVQGNQYIGGFSSLGGDANHPAIKIKKLIGTTASTQGGVASIAHGLTTTKIIHISAAVAQNAGQLMCNGFQALNGYQFDVADNGTSIIIYNHPTNSGNILSKPVVITIIYTI